MKSRLLRVERLDARRRLEPAMAARSPIELRRLGEIRVGEAADRYPDRSRQAFGTEHDPGAADGAENVVNETTRVGVMAVGPAFAGRANGALRKESAVGEGASGAALAILATAQIDVERLAAGRHLQPTAQTACHALASALLMSHDPHPQVSSGGGSVAD